MTPATNATPSLLSVAPARSEPPAEVAEGFADELSNAGSQAKAPAKPSDRAKEDEPNESSQTTPDEDPQAPAQSDHDSSDPITSEEAAVVEEGELLAVAIVSETLVVETSPSATLPAEAATQIDVATDPQVEPSATLPTVGENVGVEATSYALHPSAEETAGPPQGAVAPTGEQSGEGNESQAGESLPLLTELDRTSETDGEPAKNSSEVATTLRRTTQAEAPDSAARGEIGQPSGAEAAPDTAVTAATNPQAAVTTVDTTEAKVTPETDARKPIDPVKPIDSASEAAPDGGDESPAPSRESAAPPANNAASSQRAPGLSKPAIASTDTPPPIDPARFVSRVARAFDFAQERGGGPIEMRLSPPELGSLQVKIELREGVLTAALEAETPAARQALLDNLPALRERLEQQQIRIDKFDVDVRDESQQRGGDWQPGGDRQEADAEQPERREPMAESQPGPSEPDDTRPTPATIGFGSDEINLVA